MVTQVFKLSFYILITFININSIFARDCSEKDEGQIKVSLTGSGLQKIVSQVIEQSIAPIEKSVSGLELGDVAIIGGSDKCSKEKWKAMSTKESWKTCPGVPALFKGGHTEGWRELAKPIPSKVSLDDMKIEELKLGEPVVICSVDSCTIDVPVENFELSADVNVTDSFDGEKLIGMKETSLFLSENLLGKKPSVKFKANINANGELVDLIQLKSQFFQGNIPAGSVRLGIGGRKDLSDFALEQMEKIVDENLEKDMQLIEDEARVLVESNKLKKDEFSDWYNKRFDKLKESYKDRAVELGMEDIQGYFEGDLSFSTFYIGQAVAKTDFPIVEQMTEKAGPLISNLIEDSLRDSLRPTLGDLPFIHNEYFQGLPTVNVNDFINHEKLKDIDSELTSEIASCLKKLKASKCEFEKFIKGVSSLSQSSLPADLELLKNMQDIYQREIDKVRAINADGFFEKRRKKKSLKSLDQMANAIPKAIGMVEQNIKENDLRLGLEMVVKNVEKLSDTLEVLLSACSGGCFSLDIPDVDSRPIEVIDEDYDIAVALNIDTLNGYIESLHKMNMLDICLIENKSYQVCDNHSLFSTEHRITLKKPPKVKWDEEKKSYVLSISDLVREQDVVGLPTSLVGNRDLTDLDIPFIFDISKDGKKVVLTPKGDIDSNFDMDGRALIFPALLTVVAPFAGVAFEAIHSGAHTVILENNKEKIQELVSSGVQIPDNTPVSKIVKIKNESGQVIVYSQLKGSD